MKETMKPTILTHIWKNSCTAGCNELVAHFFCRICNIFSSLSLPCLMECCFEWITQILLNGAHKYFWMGHTNTLLTCTIFHFHRKNPTILAIAEKRFWHKMQYVYWLGRSNNIGLANKELLLQFMFAKCNAIPEEIQIQDNWKHK